jgi:hypothetical protein
LPSARMEIAGNICAVVVNPSSWHAKESPARPAGL